MNTNKLLLGIMTLGSIVWMAGCDKVETNDDAPSQIKLGVNIAQTKAPVDSVSDADLSAIGVYGIRNNTWVATPWIDNDSSRAATSGEVSFTGIYFYPVEGDTVHFYAYHPYAPNGSSGSRYVTAPSSGTAPILNFTITGQEDIMFATPVWSAKSPTTPPGTLNFNHVLTQLKFKAKTGTAFPSSVTVDSITFNGVNTKASMNIATGVLSGWTTSGLLRPAILGGGAINTSSTASDVGAPVMLQPGQSSFAVTIFTSFGTFSNIQVNPTSEGTFLPGKAYTVELTFTGTGVELSASVSAWVNTGTGAGDVQ